MTRRETEATKRRRVINVHLHRGHGGFSMRGSTDDRLAQHARLHETKDCDHVHFDWSLEAIEEMNNGRTS